ncbi:MAG: CSLREA domain-containing protein, partial [Anaerolineae bacterium]|nr:CSLREA domain-containing protein [Anaerolineae bacterium]
MVHPRTLSIFLLLVLLAIFPVAPANISAQEDVTSTPTDVVTETPTENPTTLPTATDIPTDMPTNTPTETPTIIPTETSTELPTETPIAIATDVESPTATLEATTEVTPEITITSTPTLSPTAGVLPTEPTLHLLITDTFDSGNLSNWTLDNSWSLVSHDNGQALQVFNNNNPAQLLEEDRFNVVVQANFLLDNGSAKLLVRQSEVGQYAVTLDASGQVNLFRASSLLQYATVEPSLAGEWRTLRVSAIDDILRVSVDGIEVIALRDVAMLPPGKIGWSGLFKLDGAITPPQNTLLGDDFFLWIPLTELPAPTSPPTMIPPTQISEPPYQPPQAINENCNPQAMIIRASVRSDGEVANGRSYDPAISANGRYVAYVSEAPNMDVGADNGRSDIFLYDKQTCLTTPLSIGYDNISMGNGPSMQPFISTDGRYIVFASAATNLIENFSGGGGWQIFVRDMQTNTITLVSKAPDGSPGDHQSRHPSISADGRYIAYQSEATNLTGTSDTSIYDIFLYDQLTDQTIRVSQQPDGSLPWGTSQYPEISTDGHYITYSSMANNIVADDTAPDDIFVYDRLTNQTRRVSEGSTGTPSNSSSFRPTISADGRYVAFQSMATSFGSGISGSYNIWVKDLVTNQLTQLSLAPDGGQAGGSSEYPSMSDDGRYVVYQSTSPALVYGDNNNERDVFLRDVVAGTTLRLSFSIEGGNTNGFSGSPVISSDGNFVAFRSAASNIIPNDTTTEDIFLVNLAALPPAVPLNLSVTANSSNELTLTWIDASINETAFQIERWNGVEWIEIATTDSNVTSYTDSELTCNTLYDYRIRSFRGSNGIFSAYSNIQQAWTLPCGVIQTGPNFTVNLTQDINDTTCSEDSCSLREAIIAANTYGDGSIVTIPEGVYTLTIPGTSEDNNYTGDLDIHVNMTINGAGAATTIIDGNEIDRVFHVPTTGKSIIISDITIRNGHEISVGGGGIYIYYDNEVTIQRSHLRNNTGLNGGAIYSASATLTLVESTVFNNNAVKAGGGIGTIKPNSTGNLYILRSTISDNTAGASDSSASDAMDNRSTNVSITDSTIIGTFFRVGGTITANNSIVTTATNGLGPLQDNGGPTWTRALLPNNPSIGGTALCAPTDQRGQPRDDGGCDTGAYEADYPPMIRIVEVDKSTENGPEISENETTRVDIFRLLIRFNEDMYDPAGNDDPHDISNPSNYLLVMTGPDNIVQTTSCDVLNDDVAIVINSATFNTETNKVTLELNNGARLPSGDYRFIVCAEELHDLDENAIDLNGDGISDTDVFVRNFEVQLPQTGPVFTVTLENDVNDTICGLDHCSLREAIIAANSYFGGGATVLIPADMYTLSLPGYEDASVSGDLDITRSMQIYGESAATTIIDGGAIDRVLHILNGSTVTIAGVTVQNGRPPYVSSGGGIAIEANENDVTILNSAIINNSAGDSGGGITVNSSSSKLTLINSLVSGNMTTGGDNPSSYGRGGGISNWGTLTVINSTISGNSSNKWGGGIVNYGTADLNNVTITNNIADSDNTADGLGGGIFNPSGTHFAGILNIKNTLIAENIDRTGQAPDCGGTASINSRGHNLIGTMTGCKISGSINTNIVGQSPLLGPLQDNGGTTLTHALEMGSPAINAGDNLTCMSNDQRGVFRPQGATCDIGAFEAVSQEFNLIPPTVIRTNPITLPIDVQQVEVVFAEAMEDSSGDSDPYDVTNPVNYRLVSDGADGVFQTTTCGSPQGDDLSFSIDSVTYNNATFTATVILNNGVALPTDIYRLFVCGTVRDLDGNGLDGNFDGVGEDDYFSPFRVDPSQSGPSFQVNSTEDSNDGFCGVVHCTLREAIIAANSYSGSSSIVNLPAGTYTLALIGADEDAALTGDLDIQRSLTLNGADVATTIIDGAGIDRVFHITAGDVIVSNLMLQGGSTPNNGGIILNGGYLTTNNVVIRNGVSANGGGVDNAGTIFINNTLITGNTANTGGGVRNRGYIRAQNTTFSANTAANEGGAILNAGGSVLLEAVTIMNNVALYGGGLANTVETTGEVELINTTLSGNAAQSDGGALFNMAVSSYLKLNNVTIANNTADSDNTNGGQGGGLYAGMHSEIYFQNTLIALNSALSIGASDCISDGTGRIVSLGYNLIGSTAGCIVDGVSTGNITDVDPLLGPLQENGGPTWTHALLSGSPALQKGNSLTCAATDQRGLSRSQGFACDIGAFEMQFAPLDAPSDLSLLAVASDTINLTWVDNSPDESSFSIERSSGYSEWLQIGVVAADTTTFSSSELDCNTEYSYRIRAFRDSDGQYSTYTGVVSSQPLHCAPPAAPTNLTATRIYEAQVDLRWTNNAPDATLIQVEYSSDGDNWTLLATTAATNMIYSDRTLGCNNQRYYRVRAKRSIDSIVSTYSNVVNMSTPRCTPQTGTAYTPNTFEDANDGVCTVIHCSLREAIVAANASSNITISLPPGTYTLSITGENEDLGATGDLNIRTNMIISGLSAATTVIDGNGIDRILEINASITLNLSNVTLRNGNTNGNGGAIYISGSSTVNITDSVFTSNRATNGGAIYNGISSKLSIVDSILSNNQANSNGGALYNYRSVAPIYGGVTITRSTLSGNRSQGTGGAIYNLGITGHASGIRINESTISGNTAVNGGGLATSGYSQAYLTNTTVSSNSASQNGGGIASLNSGSSVQLDFSTVAFNAAVNGGGVYFTGNLPSTYATIFANNSGKNCNARVYARGYNIAGDATCDLNSISNPGEGDLDNTDPMLDLLKDNGGPTLTHALLTGSAAINLIPLDGCLAGDQRGATRPFGVLCDVGAVEVSTALLESPTNLTINETADFSVQLMWIDNSADETAFRIERSPDGNTGWVEVGNVNAGVTTYDDTTVLCET